VIRAHKAAVLARLRADTKIADAVFDSGADSPSVPYCVVYADQGTREQERLLATQSRATFVYTIHSVGSTPDEAQWMAERVYAQLLGFRPEIEGRSCWPIAAEASVPVRRDDDPHPALFFGVDEFRLSSVPG
jgi:hypothetical protein